MTTLANSVNVTGLSTSTTQATLEHFFSFCGKIDSLQHEGDEAKITFVKESAAKTALMLNHGTLDDSTITVSSPSAVDSETITEATPVASSAETSAEKEGADVEQEDKPRSAIAAEYVAHGYILSDTAIQRAIEADQKYGISTKFLSFFNPLATKVTAVATPHLERATTKLSEVDAKRGLSLKANAAATIGLSYYRQALASPLGAKVHSFYTQTQKEVAHVHEEALRIREAKKTQAQAETEKVETEAAAPAAPAAVAEEKK